MEETTASGRLGGRHGGLARRRCIRACAKRPSPENSRGGRPAPPLGPPPSTSSICSMLKIHPQSSTTSQLALTKVTTAPYGILALWLVSLLIEVTRAFSVDGPWLASPWLWPRIFFAAVVLGLVYVAGSLPMNASVPGPNVASATGSQVRRLR